MPTLKICDYCKHYKGDRECNAFPNGIPEDILSYPSDIIIETDEDREYVMRKLGFIPFEHNKRHPLQDNDIIFEESEK